jgi:hypothetical protein
MFRLEAEHNKETGISSKPRSQACLSAYAGTSEARKTVLQQRLAAAITTKLPELSMFSLLTRG